MTTTNITTCDRCKKEICSVGYGKKSDTQFRTIRLSIYDMNNNYNPPSAYDFHICDSCCEKIPVLKKGIDARDPDYKDTVYNLLNDLLTEMGVAFEE